MPPKSFAGFSGIFLSVAENSIRERESFAPTVFVDVTFNDPAGFRAFEQRTRGAAINAIWRVLILRLLPRHLSSGAGLCNPKQQSRRNPACHCANGAPP
jgi:hypothetical protein